MNPQKLNLYYVFSQEAEKIAHNIRQHVGKDFLSSVYGAVQLHCSVSTQYLQENLHICSSVNFKGIIKI